MSTVHRKSPLAEYFSDVDCNSPGEKGEVYQATLPAQEYFSSNARLGCVVYEDMRKYNATAPGCPDGVACNTPFPSSTRHTHIPLTVACPRCEDGVAFHGNHPGGGTQCDVCDGAGVLELQCNHCGDAGAVEWFQGDPLCVACATIAREDALVPEEVV